MNKSIGNLLAIGFIWFCCAIAWGVLGSTILVRSGESTYSLRNEVNQLWGAPGVQQAPNASYQETVKVKETITTYDPKGQAIGTVVERDVVQTYTVPLDASDLLADLRLQHRRKGLMWFPTYEVDFRGRYTFVNPSSIARNVSMSFPLATSNGVFDAFAVTDAKGQPIAATISGSGAVWNERFEANERRDYTIAYRSRGTSTWTYEPTQGTGQIKNFKLAMNTDFANIDFPAGTISPSTHSAKSGFRGVVAARGPGAWAGTWEFKSLVASSNIGVTLPERLNPGPLASRITFFAPVGLLFFFFVVAVFGAASKREIHPLNYFFLACAFFAFHLLFAYLVDHLSIAASFAIASGVSIFLVVSYARLFVGWAFAMREMAISQLIYLVLFSYTFFWGGFTGLAITIGAILTLFVMMQFTGRVDWARIRNGAPKAQAT